MDDGSPKLPTDLETPVVSSPPPTPPDVNPQPIVTPESPEPVKPKKLKSNALKIGGGLLIMALLVGGIVTGRNIIQNRTNVEQQAARDQEFNYKLTRCSGDSDPGCADKPPGRACGNGGICTRFGPEDDFAGAACACKGHVPPPAPPKPKAPTPSPSPSPSPSYSCVDLTTNKAATALGDTVTITCQADFSAVSPVAFFRHSVAGGAYTESAAVTIDAAAKNASYDITIDKAGAWVTECRVCTDATAASCTVWGQAN